MNIRELGITALVALLTTVIGSALIGSAAVAEGEEPVKLPAVTLESVQFSGSLETEPTVGKQPVLLLKVKNTLESPITMPLDISLYKTDPLAMISRAMPMQREKPLCTQTVQIALEGKRSSVIRVPIKHTLGESSKLNLGTQYTIRIQKNTGAKKSQQESTVPKKGQQMIVQTQTLNPVTKNALALILPQGIQIASFSINPDLKSEEKN